MGPDDTQETNPALQELIASFLDAMDRGESVDRETFLREHPAQADSLRDFFAAHDGVVSAAGEEPTLPPQQGSEDATLAAPPNGDNECTLPPDASAQPVVPSVGQSVRYFGDYELIEEIARGGMGVVFKARQVNLNRTVALKMILAGQFAGQEDVQRFQTEAEAAAQLDHPGIVPIFEIGEHAGQHYFSMGFVEGHSLAAVVGDGPVAPREAAELVRKICDAIGYAHQRGVIHRDLKPANILMDADGQPKVTDFGLAKKTEADSGLTGTGQILGTPAYMPPEQASGKVDEVGPLADVYSIGALLYCLLTGRPPFQAASPMDTLLQVLEQEPVSPRQLNAKVSRDLETICLKCLEKNPPRRYRSASELGAELKRFLDGEPIQARPVGFATRSFRWGRRHPWKAATAAALMLALFLLAVGGPTVAIREKSLRVIADRASYGNRVQLAQREWSLGQVAAAKNALGECPEAMRGWEWNHVSRLCDQEVLVRQRHKAGVNDVVFRPDGKQFASCAYDNKIILWDAPSAQPVHELSHDKAVIRIAYSPDGQILAAGDRSHEVRLWNTSDGTLIRTLKGHAGWIRTVAFSRDGKRLGSASYDKTARIWDVHSGEQLLALRGHENQVKGITFHPDGKVVATGSEDKTIRLWDLSTGELIRVTRGHKGGIVSIEYDQLGERLITASGDGTVRLWDPQSGRCLQILEGHRQGVKIARFSPNGHHALSTGFDRTVRLWDLETGETIRSFYHHNGSVEGACFSPDGRWIASAGMDGAVRVWDVQRSDARTLQIDSQSVNDVVFVSGGTRLVVAADNFGQLWHCDTGWSLGYPFSHPQPIQAVAVHPNGQQVATAGYDTMIKIWDVDSGELIESIDREGNVADSIAFSTDGRKLIYGSRDRAARIYDFDSKQTIRLDHPEQVVKVALDSATGTVFTAASGGVLAVWDLNTGNKLKTQGLPALSTIALNPQKRQIWAAYGDGNLMAFSVDRPLSWLHRRDGAHNSPITSMSVSQDGTRVATGDKDGVLKLWDTETAEPVFNVHDHSRAVTSIEFSDDDRWLATASADGTVRLRDSLKAATIDQQAHWAVNRVLEESFDLDSIPNRLRENTALSADVMTVAIDYADSLSPAADTWISEANEDLSWSGATAAVYRRAQRKLSAAIKVKPDNQDAYLALALAHYRLGQDEKAIQTLQKWREVSADKRLFTPAFAPMLSLRQDRPSEARRALAQAWGYGQSQFLAMLPDRFGRQYERVLEESKRQFFGPQVAAAETLLAPRVRAMLAKSDTVDLTQLANASATGVDRSDSLLSFLVAEQLLSPVAEELLCTHQMADHFRERDDLPESVQSVAIAMATHSAANVQHLYDRSVHTLVKPGHTDQDYALAFDQAQEVVEFLRYFPSAATPESVLDSLIGFGQYRTGDYNKAIKTFESVQSKALFGLRNFVPPFRAMTLHQLGRTEEAQKLVPELRRLRHRLESIGEGELGPLVRESERFLGIEPVAEETQHRLFDAAKAGNVVQVQAAIKDGADVNGLDVRREVAGGNGRRPLNYAAIANDVVMIETLLKSGADVGLANRTGFTPLHHAAEKGSTEAARILIDHDAPLNSRTNRGLTPLAVAESKNHSAVIELLRSAMRSSGEDKP